MVVLLLFLGVLAVIALLLFDLSVLQNRSSSAPAEPFAALVPPRADIVDRNGVYLARTFEAYAVSVRPRQLTGDPRQRARELAHLLPGTDEDVLYTTLNDRTRVVGGQSVSVRVDLGGRGISTTKIKE